MAVAKAPARCRLVLIAPVDAREEAFVPQLASALSGGDVAFVILPANSADEAAFQRFAEAVVPIAQAAGAALIVAEDSRVAGRVKADGIHIEGGTTALGEAIEAHHPRLIVGAGGAKTRDDALALGERQPDYIFFGRFGYDNKPAPHDRNLSLGRWWSQMIQIPCILLGGSDIASVVTIAATGADFVALSSAVFGEGVDPRQAVADANALLDETAPRFEGA